MIKHRASLAVACLVTCACGDDPTNPMRVRLVAPDHASTATSRTVTFQWRVENGPPTLHCRLFTDKGRGPLDGLREEAFDAQGATQLTVELDAVRYSGPPSSGRCAATGRKATHAG